MTCLWCGTPVQTVADAHHVGSCPSRPADAPLAFAEGDLVAYTHPAWGPCTGRVLRVQGDRVLVQVQAPTGAREWWLVAGCRRVGP
jgi:hypothetical protein